MCAKSRNKRQSGEDDSMADPGTLIATEACKKGLDLVLSDIYELLKTLASGRWKKWKVLRSIDDL